MGPHNLRVRTSIWLQSSFLSDLSSTKSAKIIKNEKMANNWKLRLNFLQTKSVSLEDCNSKYLQSQERFKSCKPSSLQSRARYRFLGSFFVPENIKNTGVKSWIRGMTKYKCCWCLSEAQTCSRELTITELDWPTLQYLKQYLLFRNLDV